MYDYLVTFGREVELFWTRKFSGATILFLANKYISLVNHLFDLALSIGIYENKKVCRNDLPEDTHLIDFLHRRV